ncbi:MAG: hypothetical protein AAF108_00975 [Planctomycetota bacterium]
MFGSVAGQACVGDARAAEVLWSASSRLVDLIGIGDSNQLYQKTGWDEGLQLGLAESRTMYATGLISPQQNNGNGSGTGAGYRGVTHGALLETGAPPELAAFVDDELGNIHEYGFLDEGTASRNNFSGLAIELNCPLDLQSDLRFDFRYGVFPYGEGSFRPAVRRGVPGYAVLQKGDTTATSGPAFEMKTTSVLLPATSVVTRLEAGFTVPKVADIAAPFFGAYVRAVDESADAGFSYHTQLYLSGRSLRDMAEAFQNASDDYLADFYTTRPVQNKSPTA